MLSVVMLNVAFYLLLCWMPFMLSDVYAECHYAQFPYAVFHYVECHYAECHYAECRGATAAGQIETILFDVALLQSRQEQLKGIYGTVTGIILQGIPRKFRLRE
jgi:hypothetical protein